MAQRDWQWLATRPRQAEGDVSARAWLPRVLLLRPDEGGTAAVVGDAGFHGPPDDEGRVEIGYTVIAEHRRRGYAEEACRALLSWASAEHGITRFRASVSAGNVASLNLIRKLGLIQASSQHHDRRVDELVFHRDENARQR